MEMSESNAMNMEELWKTREERLGMRRIIGVQNQLPQSHEDEQQQFATIKARSSEIPDQTMDGNLYMVIHENGSKMTVGLTVHHVSEIPEGMVSLTLPEQDYQVFRFEEKHICSFWKYFCDHENQAKFELDVVKARFEVFNDSLQPHGFTEIFFPKAYVDTE